MCERLLAYFLLFLGSPKITYAALKRLVERTLRAWIEILCLSVANGVVNKLAKPDRGAVDEQDVFKNAWCVHRDSIAFLEILRAHERLFISRSMTLNENC